MESFPSYQEEASVWETHVETWVQLSTAGTDHLITEVSHRLYGWKNMFGAAVNKMHVTTFSVE